MMAHVRYATQGCVELANVHPFSRELWGIHWCFSHNGEVPKFINWVSEESAPRLGKTKELAYRPIGDTDSEAVFCAILNALKAEFDSLPTLPVLHAFLKLLCNEIIEGHPEETIFNFLLGCGQHTMFAYSWPGRRAGSKVWNGLHYIVRQPPFSSAKLIDVDYTIDFSTVTNARDRVAVITTKPLTCEPGWTEFQRGELLMFNGGVPYASPETCESVEKEGRGLYSRCFGKRCPNMPQQSTPCSEQVAALSPTSPTNNAAIASAVLKAAVAATAAEKQAANASVTGQATTTILPSSAAIC